MLALKPNCENCGTSLPNNSDQAMICSFECTFCVKCVDEILRNVCPNCGGGFEKRPSRPRNLLVKYPASTARILKPIDIEEFREKLKIFQKIDPRKR